MASPLFPQRTADFLLDLAERGERTERLFWKDTYEILEQVVVDDDYGGRTTEDTVVASGPCRFFFSGVQGEEGYSGIVFQSSSSYAIDVAKTAPIEVKSRIRINGDREFEVIEVRREENTSINMEVSLEEQNG